MPRIEIERLSLSLSGLSEDQGRLLAMRVAEGLAAVPASNAPSKKDSLAARATMRPGGSVTSLADQIVADLVRQLTRTV